MEKEMITRREKDRLYFPVASGVWGTKDIFVNMYMIKSEETGEWVLADTGLKSSAPRIRKMAEKLFGPGARPAAIVLTHGHFDHAGSLKKLLEEWGDVPVYCHYLELPYLSGKSAYPPADPSVGGGLLAAFSWMYPKRPINVEPHLHILPPDGTVPGLPEWRYLHTPGHAPGHVSLFREHDRLLIAGDAFVTTRQESVTSVMLQQRRISGPPKYLTYDWEAAHNSVKRLAALHPRTVATGHGKPMAGPAMQAALEQLAIHFEETAVPDKGRYVHHAAVTDASGVTYLPPRRQRMPSRLLLLAAGVTVATALLTWALVAGEREEG